MRMPRARKECVLHPDDPCCKSCGQDPGECAPDPSCQDPDGQLSFYDAEEDGINLRCWDQKRRFGIDVIAGCLSSQDPDFNQRCADAFYCNLETDDPCRADVTRGAISCYCGADTQLTTSGRPSTNRWSSVSHTRQREPRLS